MLRSMFAAVSGLRSHQTMMDVTGNNVSNVNTAGYKASSTTFEETLTQLVRGGAAGDAGAGGTNPIQIGLGAGVSNISQVFTQGASQVTGRPLDVAIQGEGFFLVNAGGGEDMLMRAGSFAFDSAGNLVAPGGQIARGWTDLADAGDEAELEDLTIANVNDYSDLTINASGVVTGRDATGELQELAQLAMVRFTNPGGLINVGGGMYSPSPNAGDLILGTAGVDGLGTLQGGTLEMSNVDLAQEFTNLILAQRGYQANARTITASDELLQELVNLKR